MSKTQNSFRIKIHFYSEIDRQGSITASPCSLGLFSSPVFWQPQRTPHFVRRERTPRNFPANVIWHSSGAGSLDAVDYRNNGFVKSGFLWNLTIPGLLLKACHGRHDFTQIVGRFTPLSVRWSLQTRENPGKGANW